MGDDFGVIFAAAISGEHRGKPLGIADVVWESGCAWSCKTIKSEDPFTQKNARLISGRNSPIYSSGIENPLADIQATGAAVLGVWNARVNEAFNEFDDVRIFVMLRNFSTLHFTFFEEAAERFVPGNYEWRKNKRGNLEAIDKATGEHVFTWQPHGGQFTAIRNVPSSCYRFRIKKRPGLIEEQHVINLCGFQDDWIVPVAAGATP